MYTYEDLVNRIAVRCNNENELTSFIKQAQEYGHHMTTQVSSLAYRNRYFDICPFKNEGRKIMCASERWYKINNYKIIDFNELDISQFTVNIEEFESVLMD